ncbi:hypothetical protein AYX15_07123 [Cryptococcus neoformans]|nr:hypothetical protein AYX15_07123 [Cryptococcus neoformans var. grubii]
MLNESMFTNIHIELETEVSSQSIPTGDADIPYDSLAGKFNRRRQIISNHDITAGNYLLDHRERYCPDYNF